MLLGGDELGRTQSGNNNAYCQDNEISWVDWTAVDADLLSFVRGLVAFRQSHPVFRRRRFLTGIEASELGWFTPAGTPMTQGDWDDRSALALGVYLDGSDAPDTGPAGQPLLDDDFLVLVNAWWEHIEFTIPDWRPGLAWVTEIDSYDPAAGAAAYATAAAGAGAGAGAGAAAAAATAAGGGAVPQRHAGDRVTVGPRSVLVMRGPRTPRTAE